ncbi:N-succinylglutamate 5-semialdehyde dehydrogenase [Rubripirellula lacrimiformis]|uniref:L-glutamate gamma-semialdehyde dehydrogenase n=1 Tax=Rubripirellula lacrimiformis TaxID=1930273 RepID=A0A517N887_9BACT|nr:aldehyde dehydrogenase family protein [Rubripirellula lacrimiformis]QDT03356.1 N-succinylglutamate 5-semialdehyde dehydrogenase [Rubripirellula lacrimiformis]
MCTSISSFDSRTGQPLFAGDVTDWGQIAEVMRQAGVAADLWRRHPVDQRIQIVRRYGEILAEDRDKIRDLISGEVGKLPWDSAGEVSASIAKAELSIAAWQQRRSQQQVDDGSGPVRRIVRYRPLGVALVLGPFNFPLHLPGGQIIPALLAGNAVVFKPSEQATAVGQWMVQAWKRAGLPDHVLQMIVGGVETAVAAIDSPHVNGVFLTGSRAAGRAIHRQLSGRPGVLLALELGGNNPVVIDPSADPRVVAGLVSFSAFVSAGQRCTCARRAFFVEGRLGDQQIQALVDRTTQMRVGLCDDSPAAHVGPLISAAAATSLRETYQTLLDLGCSPLIPWQASDRNPALVHPVILDATGIPESAEATLGEMEWFGPILVVQRTGNLDRAFSLAASTPYGLSAALLGGSEDVFQRFVDQVGAGVVNWNGPTTGAAGALPFGGLGDSGNHRPAGYYAIDFCSDPVASLQRPAPSADDPWSVVE